MSLNGHFALCFKMHVFSEPTTKIRMKIDPYYQQQRCIAMTVVSGNIRFIQIFAGFLGDEASNDSGIIENVDFQGFRTLCLRHLRKWGLFIQYFCCITWSAEMCGSGPWSAEYLGSAEILRIVERALYIVGTLTNNANVIKYYFLLSRLSPFHWLQNTWPWMTLNGHFKFCFAPVCLELWSLTFEDWLLLNFSECCWQTLNRKEQLRHGTVSLRQHDFLV